MLIEGWFPYLPFAWQFILGTLSGFFVIYLFLNGWNEKAKRKQRASRHKQAQLEFFSDAHQHEPIANKDAAEGADKAGS